MQVFLWPKQLTSKLDSLTQDFFWGGNKVGGRRLYLHSWSSICYVKKDRGLGIQKFLNINMAFVTKLGWQVINHSSGIWVNLIWARYLCGRPSLDLHKCPTNASWIMQGIWKIRSLLMNNVCIRIGSASDASIFDTPYLSSIDGFCISRPHSWLDHINWFVTWLTPLPAPGTCHRFNPSSLLMSKMLSSIYIFLVRVNKTR